MTSGQSAPIGVLANRKAAHQELFSGLCGVHAWRGGGAGGKGSTRVLLLSLLQSLDVVGVTVILLVPTSRDDGPAG